jgi:hypothetical protein
MISKIITFYGAKFAGLKRPFREDYHIKNTAKESVSPQKGGDESQPIP